MTTEHIPSEGSSTETELAASDQPVRPKEPSTEALRNFANKMAELRVPACAGMSPYEAESAYIQQILEIRRLAREARA